MDILYWINHNKDVILAATQKMFFKRYLCRMQIYCPGGRSVTENDIDDIETSIEQRKLVSRQFNYGGSWGFRNTHQLVDADINQLKTVKALQSDKNIKVRIEEPNVSFYADCEQDLKTLLERFDSDTRSRVRTVTIPKDQRAEELLRENKILKTSRRNNYQFKVVLKDGRVDPDRKASMLNYLRSLGDVVHLPKCSVDMLESKYSGFWGIYYYTNDPTINTFVELIEPGVVANVHEIVIVE